MDNIEIIQPFIDVYNRNRKILVYVMLISIASILWGVFHLGPYKSTINIIYLLIVFLSGYNCGKHYNIMENAKRYAIELMKTLDVIKNIKNNSS